MASTIKSDSYSKTDPTSYFGQGIQDVVAGAALWRLSYLMGIGEIRRRYARSKLGQFWVTLSTAFTIVALGLVWSGLFRVQVADLMLFISVSLIFWQFISGMLSEAPTAFVSAAPIMHNQGVDHSTFIYSLLVKHGLMLLHNLPILLISIGIFGSFSDVSIVSALLGLLLMMVFLFGLGYVIAIICLRFRDLTQVIQNSILVLFFITPVLWKPELMSGDRAFLLDYNPFAIYLAILQKSFLGGDISAYQWYMATGLSIGMMALALPIIGWARKRLIYWV